MLSFPRHTLVWEGSPLCHLERPCPTLFLAGQNQSAVDWSSFHNPRVVETMHAVYKTCHFIIYTSLKQAFPLIFNDEPTLIFYIYIFLKNEVQLIYNVVLISSVQQNDSVTYICMYIFLLQILLHERLLQDVEYSSLCYIAGLLVPILYVVVYIY